MKRTVRAWAVMTKRGKIWELSLGYRWLIKEADVWGHKVVPITVTYDDGREGRGK